MMNMRKLLLSTAALALSTFCNSLLAQQTFDWVNGMTSMSNARVTDLLTDASNNTIVVGKFKGTANVGGSDMTSSGNWDVFLAKYDKDGVHQWSFSIGATGEDVVNGVAMNPLNGNIVITGMFWGTIDMDPGAGMSFLISNGQSEVFCGEYDASGQFVGSFSVGGTLSDAGQAVAVDAGGNIILAGKFNDANVDFDPTGGSSTLSTMGSLDIFLARYTSGASPTLVWLDQIGGTGSDDVYDMVLDAAGNPIITGPLAGTTDFDPTAGSSNLTNSGIWDGYLAKFNGGSGALSWAENVMEGGTSAPGAITLDASGNIYIAGFFGGTVDMDPGAGTQNATANGSYDGFLAKYTPTGGYTWNIGLGAAGFNYSYDCALDASGNIMVCGSFNSAMDVDPGAGTQTLTPNGGADAFVVRYTNAGALVDAFSLGGSSEDEAICLALDATGSEYVGGRYSTTVDFDPGVGTANLTSTGVDDGFMVRYSDVTLFLDEGELEGAEVYPNPVQGQLTVLLPSADGEYTVEVFDTKGARIHSFSGLKAGKVELDSASWTSGTYAVKVSLEGNQRIFRVVR